MITAKRALGIVACLLAVGIAGYAVAIVAVLDGASRASLASRRTRLERSIDHPCVAIVLGMGPRPSSPILDRAELAVELDRRGVVSVFVTSGGQGRDEREPEARTLATALVRAGVPANRVFEDGRLARPLGATPQSAPSFSSAGVTCGSGSTPEPRTRNRPR